MGQNRWPRNRMVSAINKWGKTASIQPEIESLESIGIWSLRPTPPHFGTFLVKWFHILSVQTSPLWSSPLFSIPKGDVMRCLTPKKDMWNPCNGLGICYHWNRVGAAIWPRIGQRQLMANSIHSLPMFGFGLVSPCLVLKPPLSLCDSTSWTPDGLVSSRYSRSNQAADNIFCIFSWHDILWCLLESSIRSLYVYQWMSTLGCWVSKKTAPNFTDKILMFIMFHGHVVY